ncbi:MAG: orotidine-5'-phosphate decarboxylase [Patescibacteria group bacterium]
MDFKHKLTAAQGKNNSLLCVGLDPDMNKLPEALRGSETPYFSFNKAIIDATADLVCAFKPNSAFYEARGAGGIEELKQTCMYIRQRYPEIPIILDFKRGDIGNTNNNYAVFAFEYLGVDAGTIHPYLGQEAVQAFLDYKDKGIIVMCRNSNPGAGEFQDLEINGQKLYLKVADNIAKNWNINKNCLLVVGATVPEELAEIRQLVGDDMDFLVPGVGAQGGDVEASVKAGQNSSGAGLIINSSRAIIYADNSENFAEVARQKATETRDEINKYRGVIQ